jgi:lipoprotein signal peptidase
VFNVADVAITTGTLLLAGAGLRQARAPSAR